MLNPYSDPLEHYIDDNRLLRKPELQRLLDISRATLARWIANGKFPPPDFVQGGRSIWIFKSYQQWLSCQ
jgi:predicted DNA-binding transcriptional regulator AlpA